MVSFSRKFNKARSAPRVRRRKTAKMFNQRVISQPPIPRYIKKSIRRFTKRAFRKTQPSYGGGLSFVSSQPAAPMLALPGPAPSSKRS